MQNEILIDLPRLFSDTASDQSSKEMFRDYYAERYGGYPKLYLRIESTQPLSHKRRPHINLTTNVAGHVVGDTGNHYPVLNNETRTGLSNGEPFNYVPLYEKWPKEA